MNELLIYIVKSLIIGCIMYFFYRFYMRDRHHFRLNRVFLLTAICSISMLPFVGFGISNSLLIPESAAGIPVIRLQTINVGENAGATTQSGFNFFNLLLYIYISVSGLLILQLLHNWFKIYKIARKAEKKGWLGTRISIIDTENTPFSFAGNIFIPTSYLERDDLKWIIEHEKSHLRQYHSADLILVEILKRVFWFNPFYNLIQNCIREQHEYLADEQVITKGLPVIEYQQLLYTELTGKYQYSLINSFNFLTKKRIIMLSKNQNKKRTALTLWLAAGILLTGIALGAVPSVVNTTNPVSVSSSVPSNPTLTEKSEISTSNNVTDDQTPPIIASSASIPEMAPDTTDEVFMVVEDMPEFPGGNDAFVKFMLTNVKYPEGAKSAGKQGTVYVTFVVEKDGKISNAKVIRGVDIELDTEALRVIKLMPAWKPGKQRGKAVRTQFNLPVKFTLGDKK